MDTAILFDIERSHSICKIKPNWTVTKVILRYSETKRCWLNLTASQFSTNTTCSAFLPFHSDLEVKWMSRWLHCTYMHSTGLWRLSCSVFSSLVFYSILFHGFKSCITFWWILYTPAFYWCFRPCSMGSWLLWDKKKKPSFTLLCWGQLFKKCEKRT